MSYRIYDLNCEICGGTAIGRLCQPCSEMVSRLVGIADRNEEAFKRELARQEEVKRQRIAEREELEREKREREEFIEQFFGPIQSGGKRGPWKK